MPECRRLRLSSIDSIEVVGFARCHRRRQPADATSAPVIAGGRRPCPEAHERRHLRDDAIAFCDAVRRLRPDIAFGADIIAGFRPEPKACSPARSNGRRMRSLHSCDVFPIPPPWHAGARMPQVKGDVIRERARKLRGRRGCALRAVEAEIGQTHVSC